jgi:hypothetical protein
MKESDIAAGRVESVTRRLPNSLCPQGKNPSQDAYANGVY